MSSVAKQAEPVNSQFKVVSIEKTEAPDGGDGDNWYKYIVARDNSEIVGNMRGSLQQVTKYANEFVDNLNTRATMPKGRSTWAPSPGQKTPPKKI